MLRVVRYRHRGSTEWGTVSGGVLSELAWGATTTGDLMRKLQVDGARPPSKTDGEIELEDVELLSPITENQQVICQAKNYREHAAETGTDPKVRTFNMFFRKASSCLCGARDAIVRPPDVVLLDYEVELGLVLGRDIEHPETFEGPTLPDSVGALTSLWTNYLPIFRS